MVVKKRVTAHPFRAGARDAGGVMVSPRSNYVTFSFGAILLLFWAANS